ncbi:Protein FAM50 [Vanrija pseudolonga]|uniref:Protein FAM50 n=1 Tax=Vanrija pseudolonga TaxID=143232 RepID=A0AAF0YHN4_9TREE|nr:Protein FAM50 [Vanrija pseudolonga]
MVAGHPEESLPALFYTKQREREAAEHQRQKEALLKDSQKDHTASRFTTVAEAIDERLKTSTIGLVTLEDFQKTRDELEEEQRRIAAKTAADKIQNAKKAKRDKKKDRAKLSFALDEEEDEGAASSAGDKRSREASEGLLKHPSPQLTPADPAAKKKKLSKNPDVDTSFLPDRVREAKEMEEREELRKVWIEEQGRIKDEDIEITYSYWDGSGHRKVVDCKKGDSIAAFLGKCRTQVPELRGVSIDNLMYIKEDLIIPHHYTFYDFIINKARGKSGPLFNFDVHDDVRLLADATKEKDESHAGKVVERSWYHRHKHIFPASRWEVYDPDKDYGTYKIA